MCGILGITPLIRESAFAEAAHGFAYRGPDAYGQLERDGVLLGHHRLSILDVAARSDQPMVSADGRYAIVFNGEIYNFQEIKQTLASDYPFQTTSDTEVLLAAYARYGRSLTRHLRGMYAFAIHDRETKQITLFRDEVGIKPLYYAHLGELFCFASEAKGVIHLLATQGITPTLNETAWDLFWAFGYIPSPLTLGKEILKLERGHGACFDLTTKHLEIFEATKREEEDLRLSTATLTQLIEQSVLDHLIADRPVGLFFSGGTDSSLIAAVLHKHGINLKTFSLLMPGNDVDEHYIRAIREHLGLQGELLSFGKNELQSALDLIQSRIDEPTGDSSIFPTTYLSQVASKDVKVVLSGEGGDELFLGYHRQQSLARIHGKALPFSRALLDQLRLLSTSSFVNRVVAKGYLGSQDAAGFYLNQLSLLREQTPRTVWHAGRTWLEQLSCAPTEIDQAIALENDLLRKIDLATSYASIEGRVPLLDPRLIRYASRVAPNDHLTDGILKYQLKQVLSTYLPTTLTERPKAGFGMQQALLKSHTGFQTAVQSAWKDLKPFHAFSPDLARAIERRLTQANVGTAIITLRSALRAYSFLDE